MAEGGSSKYGRLFTEADMLGLLRFGINRRFDLITKPGMADLTLEQVVREYETEHGLTFSADEPLFLLRGQDKAAPDAVATYWDVCAGYGDLHDPERDDDQLTSDEHLAAVKEAGQAMEAWQAANLERVKIPD